MKVPKEKMSLRVSGQERRDDFDCRVRNIRRCLSNGPNASLYIEFHLQSWAGGAEMWHQMASWTTLALFPSWMGEPLPYCRARERAPGYS